MSTEDLWNDLDQALAKVSRTMTALRNEYRGLPHGDAPNYAIEVGHVHFTEEEILRLQDENKNIDVREKISSLLRKGCEGLQIAAPDKWQTAIPQYLAKKNREQSGQ